MLRFLTISIAEALETIANFYLALVLNCVVLGFPCIDFLGFGFSDIGTLGFGVPDSGFPDSGALDLDSDVLDLGILGFCFGTPYFDTGFFRHISLVMSYVVNHLDIYFVGIYIDSFRFDHILG